MVLAGFWVIIGGFRVGSGGFLGVFGVLLGGLVFFGENIVKLVCFGGV